MSRFIHCLLGLLPIWLAVASLTGARADEPRPAGVWVTERGSDRLFLVLYADGRYRLARARAGARAPLAVQWDAGTFAVGSGWLSLSADPAACPHQLAGAFRFRFVGRNLRLEGPHHAYTFGRLPARQAKLTTDSGSGSTVFGCFEGDRFVPYGASGPTSFSVSSPNLAMPLPSSSAPTSNLPLRGRPSASSMT
jgi:hypothetical protein